MRGRVAVARWVINDVIMAGKGFQILSYTRHSQPLSSEGFLACHTYCDKEESVYNSHLRGPITLTPITVQQWSRPSLFLRLDLLQLGFEHPNFCLQGAPSYTTPSPWHVLSINITENYTAQFFAYCFTSIFYMFYSV